MTDKSCHLDQLHQVTNWSTLRATATSRGPFYKEIKHMARRNISGRKHARKFAKGRRRSRKINAPSHIMRGGFRL